MKVQFHEVIKDVDTKILLEIGRRICSSDFAIRFHNNKQHPKFYKNRETVEKALRRAYEMNAFQHREQALDILRKYGNIEEE